MITWLVAAAWADPVVLRGPEAAPAASIGQHELSVGAPAGPVEVAVELRSDRGAAGASVGTRARLAEGARGWRADAGISGGLVLPLVSPTLGMQATPWVSGGVGGERGVLQGVLAAPLAAAPGAGARVPLLLELQGGARLGPAWVVPRLGVGPVWTPGLDVSVATEAALLLLWRP